MLPHSRPEGEILVHTGAGQPVRVWPLERYRNLVARLRGANYRVQVACDPDQRNWWLAAGEKDVATPRTVAELFVLADRAGAFIGNDSGPGHLAAFCGVPTFTLFGPQMPEWFAPLHPGSEWLEGKACPYKPCSDYCRFPVPLLHGRFERGGSVGGGGGVRGADPAARLTLSRAVTRAKQTEGSVTCADEPDRSFPLSSSGGEGWGEEAVPLHLPLWFIGSGNGFRLSASGPKGRSAIPVRAPGPPRV